MKKFLIQFVVLVIVIFGALWFTTSRGEVPFGQRKPQSAKVLINQVEVKVEIADTSEKRKRGLGERGSLASDSGMLFIFEKENRHPFWMKGLKFPIDFIWIRQKQVVDIIKNAKAPEPNQSDETLPIYVPREPVDMVLEVNNGFVDTHGIKVGDSINVVR